MTEELWSRLGNDFSIHQQKWPQYHSDLIEEEQAIIAVQINGKLRGIIEIASHKKENQKEIEKAALNNEKVKKYLKGRKIKKTIFVPGRLINFVVV